MLESPESEHQPRYTHDIAVGSADYPFELFFLDFEKYWHLDDVYLGIAVHNVFYLLHNYHDTLLKLEAHQLFQLESNQP